MKQTPRVITTAQLEDIIRHIRYLDPDWQDCLAERGTAFALALADFLHAQGVSTELCRITDGRHRQVTVTHCGALWDVNGAGADARFAAMGAEHDVITGGVSCMPCALADIEADCDSTDHAARRRLFGLLIEAGVLEGCEAQGRTMKQTA